MSVICAEDLERLGNAGYRIIGKNKHSAVKTCLWCKKSLRNEGHCYKQEFYGIQSHRCLQMTPSLPFCKHKCNFCWRDINITYPKWVGKWDSPDFIIERSIEAQRQLLSGFKGNEKVDMKKWEEAQNPNQVAISLAGEPTEYPLISELIEGYLRRKFTVFLVTNGTRPDVLKDIREPYQLYITLPAPNEDIYKKTCNPLVKNGWERVMESLELLNSFSCRTVIRLTLVKNLNLTKPEEYAKIVEKTGADFIEAKAYMAVGYSTERLPYSAMPLHSEIKKFAERIAKYSGYRISGEKEDSRVILLKE